MDLIFTGYIPVALCSLCLTGYYLHGSLHSQIIPFNTLDPLLLVSDSFNFAEDVSNVLRCQLHLLTTIRRQCRLSHPKQLQPCSLLCDLTRQPASKSGIIPYQSLLRAICRDREPCITRTSIDSSKKSSLDIRFPSPDETVRIGVPESEFLISTIWVHEPLGGCTPGDENDVVHACVGMGGGNFEKVRVTDDVRTLGVEMVFDANGSDAWGGSGGSGGRRRGDSTGKCKERETGDDGLGMQDDG